jgi:hypothetical protein
MKVIKNAFKHTCCIFVATYYTQMLKQQMKSTQEKGIYVTKDQHLQGTVDWLVKDPEACDWLCGWRASKDFRAVSERNQHNRQSKESVHCCGANRHVCKTQRMV